ncbi:MAG TPA: hypothetical protein VG871_10290 [Vicinamibacterales bacterium]|nr:hypothetical protein [Vicinamibacterales bacterium]
MRALRTLALAACAWLALAPAVRAEVRVAIRNGRVTIVARDATLRQILTEWARVGKTKVVNVERIPGGPLTLELKNVPEGEALDVLLRTLSGYLASPRATTVSADTSIYDSIVVMPTIAAVAPRASAPPAGRAPFAQSAINQNENEEDEQNGQARPGGPPRPPIFSTFPAPRQGGPGAVRPTLPFVRPGVVSQPPVENAPNEGVPQPIVAVPPVNTPAPAPGQSAPGTGGVAAPGMIAPVPAQPGQVQPQRPPGD